MTNDDQFDDPKITRFPDKKEREALEKPRFVRNLAPANDEPMINMPPVVKALCLINIVIFVATRLFPETMEGMVYQLGFIPARFFEGHAPDLATLVSPLTHMFLHASWVHLLMNIGMLMAFGTGIEKKIGGRRMLMFYFATGVCGAFLHAMIFPDATIPMIGASGAISGLFGGIVMMMYKDGMMGQGYKSILPLVAVWIGISIFFGIFGAPGSSDPVAWTTHVGGFIAGLFLFKPMSQLKV